MALRKRTKTLLDLAPNIIASTTLVKTLVEKRLEQRKVELLEELVFLSSVGVVFLALIVAAEWVQFLRGFW